MLSCLPISPCWEEAPASANFFGGDNLVDIHWQSLEIVLSDEKVVDINYGRSFAL